MNSLTWRMTPGVAWGIIASMVISIFAAAAPAVAEEDIAADVSRALQQAVQYYEKNDHAYQFSGFDWELIGLAGAGEDLESTRWKDAQGQSAIDYWATQTGELKGAGQLAKLAIGLMKNGYDPTRFHGLNLLEEIASSQGAEGEMGDVSYTIANHVYSMIALEMADYSYDREAAVTYLLSHYDKLNTYDPIDDQGITLNVLPLIQEEAGVNEVKELILSRFREAQNKQDGSFQASSDTTAQVLLGLSSLEEDVLNEEWSASVRYLLSQQAADGGFISPWSNGESSAFTTENALMAIAAIDQGESLFKKLTRSERNALKPYVPAIDLEGEIQVFDGLYNLIKGNELKPSGNQFILESKQAMIRADVAELATESQPLAVVVQVMQGSKVVQAAVVEADGSGARQVTAGLTLERGTYTVEVHYWYGLADKPETAKDPISFGLVVK